jgi:ribosomal protein S18 acetylase RimI-like enzyme
MPDVTIRPARPDDAEAIAAIHVASWQHAYRGILPDDYLAGLSSDDRLHMWTYILGLPDKPTHVGVAEDGGALVGFASVGPSEDGVEGEMTLYTLYLHPHATGKGIGSALLAEAERVMADAGAAQATLRVITANPHARHVYERAGWVADPDSVRIEDAWGQPVETIRYRKCLGTQNEQGCVDTDDPRG